MQRGVFISFEGSEGCGKSTQIARLSARLESAGREVLVTREPGGTAVGERIRELLQYAPEGDALEAEAELLLFAASRAQLVRELVEPAIARGTWVIADRFLDSTTVYQGSGRGLGRDAVVAVNRLAVGECLPGLTILLDMPADEAHRRAVAASRAEGKVDRLEGLEPDFYQRVREAYLALAREESERIRVVDASADVDTVSKRVWAEVERLGALTQEPQSS